MKLRVAWLAVGFCSLVLAIEAQNPGSKKPSSQLQRSPTIVETALSNSSVKLSPSTLTFGTVTIGATSPTQVVTLTNDGTAELDITSIRFTGTDAEDFLQNHTCGSSLAAGASCNISVKFRPTASGARMAELTVNDNPPASRQQAPVSGTGAARRRCSPLGAYCGVGRPPCCPGLFCNASGLRQYCEGAGPVSMQSSCAQGSEEGSGAAILNDLLP